MKASLVDKLQRLQQLDGISGMEQQVIRFLYHRLTDLVDEIVIDTSGNILATRYGSAEGPSLMIAAHADEIGAVVKSIEPTGFLRFNKIGGTIDALLVGRKVKVAGHLGVVGVKAGHLQRPEERNRVISYRDMYIDVGAKSRAEVLDLGIDVGSPITYISELSFFSNNDRVCGKALDDRIGCAILWQLLEDLQQTDLKGTLHAVVTVQEEVGLRGAGVAAYRVNPDCAIALDTIPAGDTPDINTSKELPIHLGRGPVIPVISGGSVRGNIMHLGMRDFLIAKARANQIPVQVSLLEGGTSDASAIHLVREGILTGAVTIPRRYSHSPVEMLDLGDAVNAYKLLAVVVSDMEQISEISFLDGWSL